jgi:hypothetical protein
MKRSGVNRIIGKAMIIAVGIAFAVPAAFAEVPEPSPEEMKKSLVNCLIRIQELEGQNAELLRVMGQVEKDLKRIETKAQLDSLKGAYNLMPKEPIKK